MQASRTLSDTQNVCFRFASRLILRMTGADRQTWFHNFCTADIKGLKPGQGCEAFVLNVKGKTIAHAIVLASKYDLTLLVLGHPEISLPDHLNRYVITEDVQIEDLTENHPLWYVSGERIAKLFEKSLPGSGPDYTHVMVRDRTIAVATGFNGQRDWLLLVAGPEDVSQWYGGLTRLTGDDFERIRIASRWPITGVDITQDNLPQEFCRDEQAISFTKGCYLGQETVARIDAIGHVNYFFVSLDFEGETAAAGNPLTREEKVVGRVTSAIFDDAKNKTAALGFVRRMHAVPGQSLDSAVGPATIATPAS